jgi:histidinol phosphatase-like PHP family hydrolase
MAFTDHVWRQSTWIGQYLDEINSLRRKNPDLRILAAVEAKAVDYDGNVDVAREAAQRMDYVMGVVHRYQPDVESDLAQLDPIKAAEMEAAITVRLLENPIVDVVGHPTRTYYKFFYHTYTQDPFPSDLLDKMAAKAKEQGKPLEMNGNLPHQERLLASYLRYDVPFVLGSDAHRAEEVGSIEYDKLLRLFEKHIA